MRCKRITAFLAAAAMLLSACGSAPVEETPAPEPDVVSAEKSIGNEPDMEALYQTIQEQIVLPDMASVPDNRREAILGIAEED